MTDLVQPLAAHAANFPTQRVEASVRDHLALDLVDGLAAIVGGTRARGVAELTKIIAVQLARAGVSGASRVFEGVDGFFPLYQRGEYVRERVTEGLGERLLSSRISLKPYPCGRNLHGLLDATARAQRVHEGRNIERIDVQLDAKSFARTTLTWPEHVVAAQFSIPFAVALSTASGRTSLADFDAPGSVSEAVKALFARVHVQPHDGASEEDRIVFTYAGGSRHVERTAGVRLGHPENPISREQTGNKLRDCNTFAGAPLSEQRVEAVLSAAFGIANLPSTSALTSLLRI